MPRKKLSRAEAERRARAKGYSPGTMQYNSSVNDAITLGVLSSDSSSSYDSGYSSSSYDSGSSSSYDSGGSCGGGE